MRHSVVYLAEDFRCFDIVIADHVDGLGNRPNQSQSVIVQCQLPAFVIGQEFADRGLGGIHRVLVEREHLGEDRIDEDEREREREKSLT